MRQTAPASAQDAEVNQVVAMYEFDPAELNWPFQSQKPLPLAKGQVIQVIHDDAEGGKWALGHIVGDPAAQGYFPKNYTITLAAYRKLMPGHGMQEFIASGARLPTPLNLQAWREEDSELDSCLSSTYRSLASSVPQSAREDVDGQALQGGSAPSRAPLSGRCPVTTPPTASAAGSPSFEGGFSPEQKQGLHSSSDAPPCNQPLSTKQVPSLPGGGGCDTTAYKVAMAQRAPSKGAACGAALPAFEGRPVATDSPQHPHHVFQSAAVG